jgi:uncharacterized membrane protein
MVFKTRCFHSSAFCLSLSPFCFVTGICMTNFGKHGYYRFLHYLITGVMKRIHSIDITRGIVMIIMALDHVRDLMHNASLAGNPTNLATTSPQLFFTRWITYLCAPTFVFLSGSSSWLSMTRKGKPDQSRIFLIKRGLWLILLEFSIVNFGLFFDVGFHNLVFEVIAAIGFGFIILSLLIKRSSKTIGLIGLVIVFCHGLFSLIPFSKGSLAGTVLSPLFSLQLFPLEPGRNLLIAYPPVPWLGIMLIGFASGKLFEQTAEQRKKIFLRVGFSALLLFLILRWLNGYGDPSPWSFQKTPTYTFLSFINVSKYPPSLLFCLVTLGVMFLLLVVTERMKGPAAEMISVYGKTPLFYFVLHFYLIHLLLMIVLFAQGYHWSDLNFASGSFGRPAQRNCGIPLWGVYIVWIAVVAALYKPCVWFGKYKAEHKNWWLKYI